MYTARRVSGRSSGCRCWQTARRIGSGSSSRGSRWNSNIARSSPGSRAIGACGSASIGCCGGSPIGASCSARAASGAIDISIGSSSGRPHGSPNGSHVDTLDAAVEVAVCSLLTPINGAVHALHNPTGIHTSPVDCAIVNSWKSAVRAAIWCDYRGHGTICIED